MELGIGSQDKVDRVDKGTGIVREHSIEIGNTVIVFNNIGTITIIDGVTSPLPMVIGAGLVLLGLVTFAGPGQLKLVAFLLFLAGGALLYWGFTRKPDRFLSIGTCDGRRTNIVSKDRLGLIAVRDFLQNKIESGIGKARISISASKIDVLAVGDDNKFVG